MEHVVNIKAIENKMKNKPTGNRLYHFFMGVPRRLNKKQRDEMKAVLTKEHNKLMSYIDAAELCE